MSDPRVHVRMAPLGDASGGTGAPVGGAAVGVGTTASPGVVPSQKLPNAVAATGGAPAAAPAVPSKIQAFNQALGGKKHSENWKRKTNLTGAGATHVRTFHCKLNSESVEYMDQQINQWLDEHPDYEVKMVTSTVGEWTGKIKEPAMIVTVWV